jgi:predicted nucleic-acid-binding Zn-ribbon protein
MMNAMLILDELQNADGTLTVHIAGKPLSCVVCGNQKYHERKTLLNTRGGELFNLAWAQRKAQNYICVKCGYIFWFLR